MAAASDLRTGSSMHCEQLFRDHHKLVLRVAYRVTGNMADAEDVAQSVFLRIANAGSWELANSRSYFYRAALNGALDLVRKRTRENAVGLEDDIPQAVNAGPHAQLEATELRQWLRDALTRLDPKAAEMFVLRYVEGFDLQEIARAMKTSRAVVAVILYRTRARLQKDFRLKMRGRR